MSDIAYEERRPELAATAENTDFDMPGLEREPIAHEIKMQLVRYYRSDFGGQADGAGNLTLELLRVPRGHVAIITRVAGNFPGGSICGLYANRVGDAYLLVPIAAGRSAVGGNSALVQEGELLIFNASATGANVVIEGNFQIQICRLTRLRISRADKDFADAPEIEQGTRKPDHS